MVEVTAQQEDEGVQAAEAELVLAAVLLVQCPLRISSDRMIFKVM